jgi:CRP/FNR family transcriptional regulator, cyclic AMP receptor protein
MVKDPSAAGDDLAAFKTFLDASAEPLRARLFRAGVEIVCPGEPPDYIYLIENGRAQVRIDSANGLAVIYRDFVAGDMFGELAVIDGAPRSTSVVATEDSRIYCVPAQQFRALMRSKPEAAAWLLRRLARKVRGLTQKVFELNAVRIQDRLHCELRRLVDDAGGDRSLVIEPAPTHEELAMRVGASREAVSREMSYLSRAGILQLQRRRLQILNPEALNHLAAKAADSVDTEPSEPEFPYV